MWSKEPMMALGLPKMRMETRTLTKFGKSISQPYATQLT